MLIGGLMVYLLAAEVGQEPTRVTADADVLVRVKMLANGTIRIAEWFQESGIEFEGASAMEVGHRFSEGSISVDLLVQDHLGERAERRTVSQRTTGSWTRLHRQIVEIWSPVSPDVVDGVGRVGSISGCLFEFERFHYAGAHGSTSRSDLHDADP